jgi:L-iditol 2-dehydrogenase
MKVLRYLGPRQVEVADVPRPTIGAGEVLVRTKACGVCATDVKTYLRGHPKIPAGAVLGHETTGIIAESRADNWQAGERVAVAPYVPCGACRYCDRGQFTLCEHLFESSVEPGGFSEYLRVPACLVEQGLVRLPDKVDFADGTLAEPIACCYHGLEAMTLRPGDSLLVVGDGPMGLLQTVVAREMGATTIIIAGMAPARLAWAAGHADAVVNVAETDLLKAVMSLTGEIGVGKVIVSVGQAEVAESALALVERGGAINFFAGLPGGSRVSIDPNRLHYDEIRLVGTSGFAPEHFQRALKGLARGTLDVKGLITHFARLDELEESFAESARYHGIKTVAVFD